MVAVDTNFLIRLITGEPKGQATEAKRRYDRAEARSLLVDRVILAESLYVLRSNYKFSKAESLEVLGALLKDRAFAFIDDEICSSILRIMQDSNLSPEDACLAALVKQGRAESVASFDAGLLKYLATSKG